MPCFCPLCLCARPSSRHPDPRTGAESGGGLPALQGTGGHSPGTGSGVQGTWRSQKGQGGSPGTHGLPSVASNETFDERLPNTTAHALLEVLDRRF